jgi:hypothetical protein
MSLYFFFTNDYFDYSWLRMSVIPTTQLFLRVTTLAWPYFITASKVGLWKFLNLLQSSPNTYELIDYLESYVTAHNKIFPEV